MNESYLCSVEKYVRGEVPTTLLCMGTFEVAGCNLHGCLLSSLWLFPSPSDLILNHHYLDPWNISQMENAIDLDYLIA